jgi:hypothetical protein
MPAKQRSFDISVRFPGNKKHLKQDLVRIATRNSITVTQLVTIIIEQFLASPKKKISINLK